MSNATRTTHNVKRLVDGAAGANTINIYNTLNITPEVKAPEPPQVVVETNAKTEASLIKPALTVTAHPVSLATEFRAEQAAVLQVAFRVKSRPVAPSYEPLSDDDVEFKAMAEAMKEAARLGIPFCEKCTRARLQQQARAMQQPAPAAREPAPEDIDAKAMAEAMMEAARQGVPFCEECTRARLKQKRARTGA